MKYSLIFLILFSISCEKVELKNKASDETNTRDSITASYDGIYQKDGKGGLFNNTSWYHYDFQSHLIWSLFDIYYIKTSSDTYAIQITKYYDESQNEPGIFELSIKSLKDLETRYVTVYGQGCGNPYTNPNHATCLEDPTQNIYTYLDLETLTTQKMTDEASLNESDWDIAFKTTEIKLNAGTSGPANVLGAMAKELDIFFNSAGQIDLTRLRSNEYQDKAKVIFSEHSIDESISFSLPDGIDRVMHESYWLASSDPKTANTDAWWILKSHVDDEYIKVHVLDISQTVSENVTSTVMTLEYAYQGTEDDTFGALQQISIPFSSEQKRYRACINFLDAKVEECSSQNTEFDLKFNARNWTFELPGLGMGPMTEAEANQQTTGRI